jgi:hypothetical protein
MVRTEEAAGNKPRKEGKQARKKTSSKHFIYQKKTETSSI